ARADRAYLDTDARGVAEPERETRERAGRERPESHEERGPLGAERHGRRSPDRSADLKGAEARRRDEPADLNAGTHGGQRAERHQRTGEEGRVPRRRDTR